MDIHVVTPLAGGPNYAAYIAAAAALLSAIVSYVVSARTIKNSQRQLERQLTDAADQRNRDRLMALRRDLYLPAMEAALQLRAILGKVIDVNADLSSIGDNTTVALATMGKIHLVAHEKTIRALVAYTSKLMTAYLELMHLRMPLAARQSDIAIASELADRADRDQSQVIELMKQHNLAGGGDQAYWSRLKTQFEIAKEAFQTQTEKKVTLLCLQNECTRRTLERHMELLVEVAALGPPLVLAIREEIDLPLDAGAYQEIIAEESDLARRTVQTFIAKSAEWDRGAGEQLESGGSKITS